MIHPLFVLFNGIVIFLLTFFTQDHDPRITGTLPGSLLSNHESVVEIHISKGKLAGFASFQLDLPGNFTIRDIESSDAQFSLNEGQGLWTWQELPEEEELVLIFGITPSAEERGKRNAGGTFYYIENNEKKSRDLAVTEIVVMSENESEKVPVRDSSDKSNAKQTEEISHAEPSGKLEVQRTVANGTIASEKRIDIVIHKGITRGFARYSDLLTEGFTARALKTDGSSFSVADGKLKFVWVSVPDKEEMSVSYILQRKSEAKEIALKGEYSYLEHNQSKKIDVADLLVSFSEMTVVANAAPEKKAELPEKELPAVVPAEQLNSEKRLESQARQQQNMPNFSIQIGAFTNSKVKATTLKRKFSIRENIKSEMQEGYSKFMIGTHNEYSKARQKREKVVNENGVKSAFVVAYNNGKRITVQEALMVLNQKWFK